MSSLVLQSFCWGRESWLLYLDFAISVVWVSVFCVLQWGIQRGFRGFAWTPPRPRFTISYENYIIWSQWDQIISLSWDFKENETPDLYTYEPLFRNPGFATILCIFLTMPWVGLCTDFSNLLVRWCISLCPKLCMLLDIILKLFIHLFSIFFCCTHFRSNFLIFHPLKDRKNKRWWISSLEICLLQRNLLGSPDMCLFKMH